MHSLSIGSVASTTPREVIVAFNEPINLPTLRVMIENQKTREMITILGYQETNNPNVAKVELSADLATSTTYKVTVSTATAKSGNTINA